jgi:predicted transcriptional regulator
VSAVAEHATVWSRPGNITEVAGNSGGSWFRHSHVQYQSLRQ